MKYLIILFCLSLVGCGSVTHAHHHKDDADNGFKKAIQQVMDARRDIRTVICHPPRTQTELVEIADMDSTALLFSARDFSERLKTLSLKDCPDDFKDAFTDYVAAWNDRAAANPDLLVLVQTASTSQLGPVQNPNAERTEGTWNVLKAICKKYHVTVE